MLRWRRESYCIRIQGINFEHELLDDAFNLQLNNSLLMNKMISGILVVMNKNEKQ